MGLFNRKIQETGEADALAAELATLRAVLVNYPPGHRLKPGERCACPKCGALSFVVLGNRVSKSTSHRCADCQHAWVITERATAIVEAEDARSMAKMLEDAQAAGDGRPLQVLLVEDDPADAAMVQSILAPAIPGVVQLVHVDSRHEAESVASLGFDVVLLDLNLPDSRGMKTAEHFSAAHPDAHVCVCTGDRDLADSAVRQGRPILHKRHLVDLIDLRHQGTAELIAVLRTTAAA